MENTRWKLMANYEDNEGIQLNPPRQLLGIRFEPQTSANSSIGNIYFFPEQPNVLSTDWTVVEPRPDDVLAAFYLAIPLQQNGDKPAELSGVLVSDQPLIGNAKAVYISEFPVASGAAAATGAPVPSGGATPPVTVALRATVPPAPAGNDSVARSATATSEGNAAPRLGTAAATIGFLGLAFIGGLILNLMPCVLPVLSLKVFSLMKHAGENPKAAWIQGVGVHGGRGAFVLGAGGIAARRCARREIISAGDSRCSRPDSSLALIFLFFLLGAESFWRVRARAVAGRTRCQGDGPSRRTRLLLRQRRAGHAGRDALHRAVHGLGARIRRAATGVYFAADLHLPRARHGDALSAADDFSGRAAFRAEAGRVDGSVQAVHGLPPHGHGDFSRSMFSARWWARSRCRGSFSCCCWRDSRRGFMDAGRRRCAVGRVRFAACVIALGLLGYAINWGVTLAKAAPPIGTSAAIGSADDGHSRSTNGWQPWSQAAVDAALAQGRPVFVDFTAAWCLSCKVNEPVALDTDAVKQAFAQKNVALFRADWTHSDPAISKTLQKFQPRRRAALSALFAEEQRHAASSARGADAGHRFGCAE